MKLPKVLVFDLDGCTWWPEMYHLWGSGGSPFKPLPDGNVVDRSGTKVELMAGTILTFFKKNWDFLGFSLISSVIQI